MTTFVDVSEVTFENLILSLSCPNINNGNIMFVHLKNINVPVQSKYQLRGIFNNQFLNLLPNNFDDTPFTERIHFLSDRKIVLLEGEYHVFEREIPYRFDEPIKILKLKSQKEFTINESIKFPSRSISMFIRSFKKIILNTVDEPQIIKKNSFYLIDPRFPSLKLILADDIKIDYLV